VCTLEVRRHCLIQFVLNNGVLIPKCTSFFETPCTTTTTNTTTGKLWVEQQFGDGPDFLDVVLSSFARFFLFLIICLVTSISKQATAQTTGTTPNYNDQTWKKNPAENKDDECCHHWLLEAKVFVSNFDRCPVSPAPENNNRSPDDGDEVGKTNEILGDVEEGENALLVKVEDSVTHEDLLEDQGDESDNAGNDVDDTGHVEIFICTIFTRLGISIFYPHVQHDGPEDQMDDAVGGPAGLPSLDILLDILRRRTDGHGGKL